MSFHEPDSVYVEYLIFMNFKLSLQMLKMFNTGKRNQHTHMWFKT